MRSSGQVFLFDKFLVDIGTSSDLTLSCYNEDVLKAYKYYIAFCKFLLYICLSNLEL